MSCAGNGYLSGNELVSFPFEDGQRLAWEPFSAWRVTGVPEGWSVSISWSDEAKRWGALISRPADIMLEILSENIYETFMPIRFMGAYMEATRVSGEEAQAALCKCFVDAAVTISDNGSGAWPRIGAFEVSGQSIAFSLACGDDMVRLSATASGEKFPVISGSAPWGSYVVVVSSAGIREFCEFCETNQVSPPSPGSSSPSETDGDGYLRVCAKCVTMTPMALSSIRVYDGVSDRGSGPHFVMRGDVTVRSGNNMVLSNPDDETGIRISAVPGAGTGAVPCHCEESGSVASILRSPDGHVRIFNDTCYDIEPRELAGREMDGVLVPSRVLMLHAKCTACCTCGMYESIVNDRLAPLADAVRQAKRDISDYLSKYEDAVSKFNKRISKPSLSDISLTLSGVPTGGKLSPKLKDTEVSGKMGRCAFTAMLRNGSFFDITAKITGMSGSGAISGVDATWSESGGGSKSKHSDTSLSGSSFSIRPGGSLAVTFVVVKNQLVNEVKNMTFSGTFSVSLSSRKGTLGKLSKSVTV